MSFDNVRHRNSSYRRLLPSYHKISSISSRSWGFWWLWSHLFGVKRGEELDSRGCDFRQTKLLAYNFEHGSGSSSSKWRSLCWRWQLFEGWGPLLVEVLYLLTIMKDILPIGQEEWDEVVTKHSVGFPGRDVDSIWRKYAIISCFVHISHQQHPTKAANNYAALYLNWSSNSHQVYFADCRCSISLPGEEHVLLTAAGGTE